MPIRKLTEELKRTKSLHMQVKVIPKSSKSELVGLLANGVWKVRIKAIPEKGKANKELITFLAKELNVPITKITIVRGETSHHKLINIHL